MMSSTTRNILSNLTSQILVNLINLVCIPFYLKFLGTESYGVIGFYLSLQGMFSLLDMGLGSTLTRELSRLSVANDSCQSKQDTVRTLECVYWGISSIIGVGVFILSTYLSTSWLTASSISHDRLTYILRLVSVVLFLQFPIPLYRAGLVGCNSQVKANALLAFASIIKNIGAVMVLWLVQPTLEAYFLWQIIAGIVTVICFVFSLWTIIPVRLNQASFRRKVIESIYPYSSVVFANSALGVIQTQLDKLILARFLPLELFASYSIASTVSSALWTISIPFNSAIFPEFVRYSTLMLGSEIKDYFYKMSQFLSVAFIPAAITLGVFSEEILFLWTQNAYLAENASLPLRLLIAGTMINGMVSIPCTMAYAYGWPQLVASTNVLLTVIVTPLMIFLTYKYGVVGAASSWVILNVGYLLLLIPKFFRKYFPGEVLLWYSKTSALPAIITLVVTTTIYLLAPLPAPVCSKVVVLFGTWLIAVSVSGALSAYVRDAIWSRITAFTVCAPVTRKI